MISVSGLRSIYMLFDRVSDRLDLFYDKTTGYFKERFTSPFIVNLLYISLFFLLTIIAGLRKPGIDRDWFGYEQMIKSITASPEFWLRSHELSFSVIVNFADKVLNNPVTGTFLIYAILGVGIKLYAIKIYSRMQLFSIFIYISIFYVLFDMTGIRAGVASSICLLSIQDIAEKKPVPFFLKAGVAFFFHYSAVVMIPLYFLTNRKPLKVLYLFLPVAAIIAGYYNLGSVLLENIKHIFPAIIESKITGYLSLSDGLKIFAPYFISKVMILYYSLFSLDDFKGKYDYLEIKIFAWAIIILYMFSPSGAIASRIFDFFALIQIFLFPSIIIASKRKTVMLFLFICYLLMTFYHQLFIQKLLNFGVIFSYSS